MTTRDKLHAALAPKSVAIVGASDNPDKNRRGARTRYRRQPAVCGQRARVRRATRVAALCTAMTASGSSDD
ncbi:MAG TPA: hypothetical protein VFB20_12815 [Burkholderiales bacterium]|nr:hypothetical protein [Burkholderiales bacterium]